MPRGYPEGQPRLVTSGATLLTDRLDRGLQHSRRKFGQILRQPTQPKKFRNVECARRVVDTKMFRSAAHAHKDRVPIAKLLRCLFSCLAERGGGFLTTLLATSECELVDHRFLPIFQQDSNGAAAGFAETPCHLCVVEIKPCRVLLRRPRAGVHERGFAYRGRVPIRRLGLHQ